MLPLLSAHKNSSIMIFHGIDLTDVDHIRQSTTDTFNYTKHRGGPNTRIKCVSNLQVGSFPIW